MQHIGELLTVNEAADRLRVSAGTVHRLVKRGLLPAFQVGSQVRIAEPDLDRYLLEHRLGAPRPALQGAVA